MAFSDPTHRDLAAHEPRRPNSWRAGAFDYQRLDAYVVAREALLAGARLAGNCRQATASSKTSCDGRGCRPTWASPWLPLWRGQV
jgi:hypothetical protein